MLVHILGKVIFSSARFCSRSLPVSGWKRKTENARWSGERPLSEEDEEVGGGIKWPEGTSA